MQEVLRALGYKGMFLERQSCVRALTNQREDAKAGKEIKINFFCAVQWHITCIIQRLVLSQGVCVELVLSLLFR